MVKRSYVSLRMRITKEERSKRVVYRVHGVPVSKIITLRIARIYILQIGFAARPTGRGGAVVPVIIRRESSPFLARIAARSFEPPLQEGYTPELSQKFTWRDIYLAARGSRSACVARVYVCTSARV